MDMIPGLTDTDISRVVNAKVPITSGSGFGICRVASMFASIHSEHPVISLSDRSVAPSDLELAQLRSYAEFVVRREFPETAADTILGMPLPMITGTLTTTIFLKRDTGSWAYRRPTWTQGPTFAPAPDRNLTLPELIDLIERTADQPDSMWNLHKRVTPDLFTTA